VPILVPDPMALRNHGLNGRGGIVLDLVLAFAVVIVGAFALETLGLSFGVLFHGALRFFGV